VECVPFWAAFIFRTFHCALLYNLEGNRYEAARAKERFKGNKAMTDMAVTTTSRRYQGGWLLAPSYDLTFIFGVLALAVVSGLVVLARPDLFFYVMLADLWLLGYHHVISTFTKLTGTKEDRRENRFLIFYLPPIILATVAALAFGIGVWTIITIYFFWQWYHYVRQSYGIGTFYLRKQEKPSPYLREEKWINNLVIWSVPIWGILYRCYQGWDEFLFHGLWMPTVPLFVVQVAGAVACVSAGLWLLTCVIAWMQSRLPLARSLFIASHICTFYVGYIAINDINIGWLVANIWHNAQYVLFVWLYNTNRFKNPEQGAGGVMAYISQRTYGRVLAYFAFCLMATTAVYSSMIYGYRWIIGENEAVLTLLYIMTFQTVNFHHYVVDAKIWKARSAKNSSVMNVRSV